MVNIKTNTEKYRVVVVLASYADHVDKCFRNLAAFVDAAQPVAPDGVAQLETFQNRRHKTLHERGEQSGHADAEDAVDNK